MIVRLIAFVLWFALAVCGCAQDQGGGPAPASPEQEGWTRLGRIDVPRDSDNNVIAAGHLTGAYRSLRLDSDGPAQISRIVVTYSDGSVFLPEQSVVFDAAGTQTLSLPESRRRIDRVALAYSGGRLARKTIVTLWVK